MTIKEFCKEYYLIEEQFYGKVRIDSELNLSRLDYLPDGFSAHILGYLDLEDIKKLSSFNPIVVGWLDLCNLIEIEGKFAPIVAGGLWLNSLLKLPMDGHICLFNPVVGRDIYLNKNVICGDLHCEESVKESLSLMLRSTDKEIVSLAVNLLWKYRTKDIKEISQGGKIKFV